MPCKWKKAAKKIGKGFQKTVSDIKHYTSPEQVMKRKQMELKRLKIDSQIAQERKKLEKNKPSNPFGDLSF